MIEKIAARLKAVRAHQKLSTADMAKKMGLKNRKSWEGYENGSNSPKADVLYYLTGLGYNPTWVLKGEGQMLRADDLEMLPEAEFIGVPRYDATLAAGSGAFNERARLIDYIPFTKEFMANKLGRSSSEGLVILEARGDSMEPTINGGDLVLIDQRKTGISDGIIAFVLDDTAFVKRISASPGGVEVISDNHMYPPYKLEQSRLDDLHVIGRVRWIGKTIAG